MLTFLSVISLVICLVHGQTTNVQQCTRNPGELPVNIHVHDCIDPPCSLVSTTYAKMDITFKATRNMSSMRSIVVAYMPGFPIPIPYPLQEHAVTCDFLSNTYCPVLADEVVLYNFLFYIQPSFPVGTQTTLEFRVVDQDSQPVFCMRVPITIAPAEDEDDVKSIK